MITGTPPAKEAAPAEMTLPQMCELFRQELGLSSGLNVKDTVRAAAKDLELPFEPDEPTMELAKRCRAALGNGRPRARSAHDERITNTGVLDIEFPDAPDESRDRGVSVPSLAVGQAVSSGKSLKNVQVSSDATPKDRGRGLWRMASRKSTRPGAGAPAGDLDRSQSLKRTTTLSRFSTMGRGRKRAETVGAGKAAGGAVREAVDAFLEGSELCFSAHVARCQALLEQLGLRPQAPPPRPAAPPPPPPWHPLEGGRVLPPPPRHGACRTHGAPP